MTWGVRTKRGVMNLAVHLMFLTTFWPCSSQEELLVRWTLPRQHGYLHRKRVNPT
jgi:hypothetical protein